MSDWRTTYLIHGDDHGRVAERRASLRGKAEELAGANGVEVFEGDASTPDAVAGALLAMTFAMGHRFIVVDGVERWKDAEVKTHLVAPLAAMDPDTTVAFFGREDGRAKTPPALVAAVKKAGGAVAEENALKAKELPRWVTNEASRLGIEIDGVAARRLVEVVGERQQRLERELEKLALEHGPGARLGLEEVEAVASHSAERQVWGLVDAIVARDRPGAIRAFLTLRAQGEAVARLLPLMARRLRDLQEVASRLEAGESPAQIKADTKGSPWQLDKRLREARGIDLDGLRAAIESLAVLEWSNRGLDEMSEDTAAVRCIARIAA